MIVSENTWVKCPSSFSLFQMWMQSRWKPLKAYKSRNWIWTRNLGLAQVSRTKKSCRLGWESVRKVIASVEKINTNCAKWQFKEKSMSASFMKIVFSILFSILRFTETCFRRKFHLVHKIFVQIITVHSINIHFRKIFLKEFLTGCPLYSDSTVLFITRLPTWWKLDSCWATV